MTGCTGAHDHSPSIYIEWTNYSRCSITVAWKWRC